MSKRDDRFDRYNGRRDRDPGDTRQFLQRDGWELIDETGGRCRWVGYYEGNGRQMPGGLIHTAAGKRKFYVKNPTHRFWTNSHEGGCFLKPSNTVKNAYQVHFTVQPDAWVDGIRRIEAML